MEFLSEKRLEIDEALEETAAALNKCLTLILTMMKNRKIFILILVPYRIYVHKLKVISLSYKTVLISTMSHGYGRNKMYHLRLGNPSAFYNHVRSSENTHNDFQRNSISNFNFN